MSMALWKVNDLCKTAHTAKSLETAATHLGDLPKLARSTQYEFESNALVSDEFENQQ